MEVYVGTSGWMYDWNKWGNLDWYIRFSGLNAVELNASFYRFPFPNQVRSWARKSGSLHWAVKVNRIITHYKRLNTSSYTTFEKFLRLFQPLDDKIDFYLLQLPPTYRKTPANIDRLRRFAEKFGLGERLAVEFRHESWFNDDTVSLCGDLGLTLVSIDSPIGVWIKSSNGVVYLRMHGRSYWYAHEYTEEELKEDAEKIVSLKPRKTYVFFNNNHWMLSNARTMRKILEESIH
ncbi:MAG: DUF72 domain-containing protein [Crenarchaeota archaeon]|nr:DUF72 domain-containing protein [Thermoproteota archaeon]